MVRELSVKQLVFCWGRIRFDPSATLGMQLSGLHTQPESVFIFGIISMLS